MQYLPPSLKHKGIHASCSGCTMWRIQRKPKQEGLRQVQNISSQGQKGIFILQGAPLAVTHAGPTVLWTSTWEGETNAEWTTGSDQSVRRDDLCHSPRGRRCQVIARIHTYLLQLLVGIPLPHILVFVVCGGIALPGHTHNKSRAPAYVVCVWTPNNVTNEGKSLYSQRSRSWVVIWTSKKKQTHRVNRQQVTHVHVWLLWKVHALQTFTDGC